MSLNEDYPSELPDAADKEYGVLFCLTGKEQFVADLVNRQYPKFHALAVYKEWFRYSKKERKLVQQIVLPGYVFFEAPPDTPIAEVWHLCRTQDVMRILCDDDKNWVLYGGDRCFAEWIFRYNGYLRRSQALEVNDRIQIIDGPMKDIEGKIKKIDRRKNSGLVEVTLGKKIISVWLNFEIVQGIEKE